MKTKPQEIIREASRRNIRLEAGGDQLVVHFHGPDIPPDFERILRANKRALLAYLRKKQAAFLHIAKQVFAGEFTGASAIVTGTPIRELGWQQNPLCHRASEKLRQDHRRAHPPEKTHDNRKN